MASSPDFVFRFRAWDVSSGELWVEYLEELMLAFDQDLWEYERQARQDSVAD